MYILLQTNEDILSIRVLFEDSREREGIMLHDYLLLLSTHEHSDIYSQLCMWDDYHAFLIASLVTTRLLLDGFDHFIELPFWLINDAMLVSVCLLEYLILDSCYSSLSLETVWFKLTSTISIVLQANRLTKCARHSSFIYVKHWW